MPSMWKRGVWMKNKSEKMMAIRKIESHLRNLGAYRTGIKNLEKQLDYILPNTTASYEAREGSFSFTVRSSTEDVAIDRIEGKRALDIREKISRFSIIIETIEAALADLKDQERTFIDLRYFQDLTFQEIAHKMDYTESTIFMIRNQAFHRLLITCSGITSF